MSIFCCCVSREKQSNKDRPEKHINFEQDIKRHDQDYNKNQGNQNRLNISESQLINTWNLECINKRFDRLEIKKSNYDNLIIFLNIFYYYCQKSLKQYLNQPNNYECEGKLYHTEYDQNKNPKFTIKQGNFLINLEEKSFKIIEGDIQQIERSDIRNEEIDTKNVNPNVNNSNQEIKINRIIILDQDSKEQINGLNQQICQQQKNQKIWCKYNQQISSKDINILSQKLWITSSIIDSYVLYLNLSTDHKYFLLSQKDRNIKKRILFMPTSLTTNFGENYDINKARDLFEQENPRFKDMNFELSELYNYIGFPINKKNCHWYFLLFDFNSKKVLVFDSLQNSNQEQDQKLIKTIAQILKVNIQQVNFHSNSGQQRDSYSCGYRVCSLMQFYQERQFVEKLQYKYKEEEMISQLKQLIQDS